MHTMAQKVYHISESFVAFETFKYERANDVKAISDKFDCETCGLVGLLMLISHVKVKLRSFRSMIRTNCR